MTTEYCAKRAQGEHFKWSFDKLEAKFAIDFYVLSGRDWYC